MEDIGAGDDAFSSLHLPIATYFSVLYHSSTSPDLLPISCTFDFLSSSNYLFPHHSILDPVLRFVLPSVSLLHAYLNLFCLCFYLFCFLPIHSILVHTTRCTCDSTFRPPGSWKRSADLKGEREHPSLFLLFTTTTSSQCHLQSNKILNERIKHHSS